MKYARHVLSLLIGAVMLAACAQFGYEEPRTFKEQVAYASAGIGAATDTLVDLTCLKYLPGGQCATTGKPMHPAVSKGYLDNLERGQLAAKAAGAMPPIGGKCFATDAAPSTPQACLQIASLILSQVQGMLKQFAK